MWMLFVNTVAFVIGTGIRYIFSFKKIWDSLLMNVRVGSWLRTSCPCSFVLERGPAFPIAGGQYLTVSAAKAPGGKAARLVLPLGHLMHSGDLCLSFRHKVTGLHSGTLQVFVRKHGAHGAALWGRNGGHGWRQTQITLRGADVKSVSRSPNGGSAFRGEPGNRPQRSLALVQVCWFVAFPGHKGPIHCFFLKFFSASPSFFAAALTTTPSRPCDDKPFSKRENWQLKKNFFKNKLIETSRVWGVVINSAFFFFTFNSLSV